MILLGCEETTRAMARYHPSVGSGTQEAHCQTVTGEVGSGTQGTTGN